VNKKIKFNHSRSIHPVSNQYLSGFKLSVRKRDSHILSEREGTRVRTCVRLDVRVLVMGRVCVHVLHKSCLTHFDLLVCPHSYLVSGRQPETLLYFLCV